MKFVMLPALLFCSWTLANTPGPAGFTKIKESEGITEYELGSNGLKVLLLPDRTTPAVTFMVTYLVGARNESYGTTGATHLLEHLMFKGTEKHNKEAGTGYDQLLERTGATTNATTWLDRTNYFATVTGRDLPLLIELEADRMRNLRLREADRRPEMTVVRNEYERGENNPANALDTEIWANAFMAHPYHHQTIGWRSDFEKVPIEKLREFYDTYYWPDNATVTVIGDFETEKVLALINEKYGAISRAPKPIPQVYTEEPPQTGPRRVVMKRPGELGVVVIAHKSPRALHADYASLSVLTDILSTGRNSRFYKALTDQNLTTDVSSWAGFHRDPSLHQIVAELTPGTEHQKVEGILLAEIGKVKQEGVTEAEVASAIARLTAQIAFSRDGTFARASQINESIAVGDWTIYNTHAPSLRKVTAQDVQRVAKDYLIADQSTTGWYIPGEESQAVIVAQQRTAPVEEAPEVAPAPARSPVEMPSPPAVEVAKLAPKIVREKVAGLDVLVSHTGVQDVVTLVGMIPMYDPAKPGMNSLLAGMMDRGTTKKDADKIAALLDEVGASIEFSAVEGGLKFTASLLKKDLDLVVTLLAEQLREPAFSAEELEKFKVQKLAEIEQSRSETDVQSMVAFSRAAFPEGHPTRRLTPEENMGAVKALSREDLLQYHKAWCGSAAMVLVAVGDVDEKNLKVAVERSFAGWSGGKTPAKVTPASAVAKSTDVAVPIAGKKSVSYLLGQPSGLHFADADTVALLLATNALGDGFTSRLVGTVRDTEGLTYGIGARMGQDTFADGLWLIRASFAPATVERGEASTRRELAAWYEKGLTAGELSYRKSAMAGDFRVGLATTSGLAGMMLATICRGLPLSWLDDYPAQIEALTLDQVNEVIRRRLNPDKMIQVRAGTLQ